MIYFPIAVIPATSHRPLLILLRTVVGNRMVAFMRSSALRCLLVFKQFLHCQLEWSLFTILLIYYRTPSFTQMATISTYSPAFARAGAHHIPVTHVFSPSWGTYPWRMLVLCKILWTIQGSILYFNVFFIIWLCIRLLVRIGGLFGIGDGTLLAWRFKSRLVVKLLQLDALFCLLRHVLTLNDKEAGLRRVACLRRHLCREKQVGILLVLLLYCIRPR
jgi:hypothetical protein